jgi:hypothetical protein
MDRFQDVVEIWDNGAVSPINPPAEDIVAWLSDFFARTGARMRVATQWTFQGRKYESEKCPVPIPDYSGLVYPTKDWKQWIVLNPDGTTRLTIDVPKIRLQSSPENGELGEPRYMEGKPPHIMYGEGSDGYRDDCRFFFNMHTGQLENVELVGRHW